MWTGSAGQEVNTGEKWYDAEEELELPEDDVATAVRQDPTPVTAHVSDGERANSALGLNVWRIKILSSCSCFHSRISQSGGHELCVSKLPSNVTEVNIYSSMLFE